MNILDLIYTLENKGKPTTEVIIITVDGTYRLDDAVLAGGKMCLRSWTKVED